MDVSFYAFILYISSIFLFFCSYMTPGELYFSAEENSVTCVRHDARLKASPEYKPALRHDAFFFPAYPQQRKAARSLF